MDPTINEQQSPYASIDEANQSYQQLMPTINTYDSIREELVNVAITFLLNPKIQSSSLQQKRQFLASKGLTHDEINVAIDRFFEHLSLRPNLFNGPMPVAAHPHHPIASLSFLSMTRMIAPPVLTIAVFCYGVHWLYFKYLHPMLYGPTRRPTDELKNQIQSLSENLQRLQRDIARIDFNLKSHLENQGYIHEMNLNSANRSTESFALSDVKSEIVELKAMLLGKNQFPTTPATSASIPAWQLPASKKSDIKTNPSTSNDSEPNKSNNPSPSPEAHSDSTCKSSDLSTFEMVSTDSNVNSEPSSNSSGNGQTTETLPEPVAPIQTKLSPKSSQKDNQGKNASPKKK